MGGVDELMWNISAITEVCVPLFFLISGYLFFQNKKCFNTEFFIDKIRKRIRSLLIPYLIANIVTLLIALLLGFLHLPSFVKHVDLCNILRVLTIQPIDAPLWFIRDLICLVFLSPILYYMLKWTKGIALIPMFAIWYWDECTNVIPGFMPKAVFFFSCGAFLSIRHFDIGCIKRNVGRISVIITILAYVIYVWQKENWLGACFVLSAITTIIYLGTNVIGDSIRHISQNIVSATFFIYLYHGFLYVVLKRLLVIALKPVNGFVILVVYVLTFSLVIVLLSVVFQIAKKNIPKTLSIVIGGR